MKLRRILLTGSVKLLTGLALLVYASGCGTDVTVPMGPPSAPPPVVTPPGPPVFADVQAIFIDYCSGCHSNSPWLTSEIVLLRTSSVKARVQNTSMPPLDATPLPRDKRAEILEYFEYNR